MKLIYMYVEKFRNLKNAEFHFDRTFDIKMNNENNTLDISESANSSTIKNVNDYLFKDTVIDNVTAIIGENGVGKSSILDAIQYYCDSDDEKIGEFILAFSSENRKIHIVSNKDGDFYFNERLKSNIIYTDISNIFKNMHIVKLSNLFDIQHYYESPNKNSINLTDVYLMREDSDFEVSLGFQERVDILFNHHSYQTKRQFDFFINYKESFQELGLPIKMPSELQIQVINFFSKINVVLDSKNRIFTKEHCQSLKDIFLEFKDKNLSIFQKIAFNLILDVLHDANTNLLLIDDSKKKYSNYLFKRLNVYISLHSGVATYSRGMFESLRGTFRSIGLKITQLKYVVEKAIDFIDALLKEDLIFKIDQYASKPYDENSWGIDIERENDLIKLVYALFDANKKCACFKFNWRGLSSGEYNMLNTFAKLFSIIYEENIKQKQHILLLIDEADATFHPEWQANYMNFLIKYLNSLFEKKSIQIILTTHSPIILSDFVSFNTIYLSGKGKLPDENYTKTFGQNIFTLFSNAFFLEYPKGRFVKEIMLKIDEELKSFDKDSDEKINFSQLKDVINEIGEPIIRNLYISKLESLREHYKSSELNELMKLYEGLGTEERNEFIDFIISKEE